MAVAYKTKLMSRLLGHETGGVFSVILISRVGEFTMLLLVKFENGTSECLLSTFLRRCSFA